MLMAWRDWPLEKNLNTTRYIKHLSILWTSAQLVDKLRQYSTVRLQIWKPSSSLSPRWWHRLGSLVHIVSSYPYPLVQNLTNHVVFEDTFPDLITGSECFDQALMFSMKCSLTFKCVGTVTAVSIGFGWDIWIGNWHRYCCEGLAIHSHDRQPLFQWSCKRGARLSQKCIKLILLEL